MCVVDILIILFMFCVMVLFYLGYEWKVYGFVGLVLCKVLVFMYEIVIVVFIFMVVVISCDCFFFI